MQLLYIFKSSSLPKKAVHYKKRYSRLKIKKKNFESRFLREHLIDRLEILTSYCTNWMLLVVEISSDYLHLFFRKKLFLKKFAFLLSHDNKSKNSTNVLKIWHRCSLYISSERVRCPEKSVHYENRYSRLKIKKKILNRAFSVST